MSIKEVVLSSGRTVRVKPMNGTKILLNFNRMYPAPSPKWQEVNYGTEKNPDIRREFNYASPEYIQQKLDHAEFQKRWLNDPLNSYDLLVNSVLLNEEEKEEARQWIKDNGNPFNLSLNHIFFEEILSLDGDDEKLVAEAITSSIPAPQEVRAIQDSFQD